MADDKDITCFLCKHDLKTAKILVAIGTKGLIICPDCLENIDADKMSVYSITKDDIEESRLHYELASGCGCGGFDVDCDGIESKYSYREVSWVYEPDD